MTDKKWKCPKCGGVSYGQKRGRIYCHSYRNGRSIITSAWDWDGLDVSKFPDKLFRGDNITCGHVEEVTNTNFDLAQLAAERLANQGQLRGTEAFAAKVIADTYAKAMAERKLYQMMLVQTQVIMEVLASQIKNKPYREMTEEFQGDIVDQCSRNRATILPQPPEVTT